MPSQLALWRIIVAETASNFLLLLVQPSGSSSTRRRHVLSPVNFVNILKMSVVRSYLFIGMYVYKKTDHLMMESRWFLHDGVLLFVT